MPNLFKAVLLFSIIFEVSLADDIASLANKYGDRFVELTSSGRTFRPLLAGGKRIENIPHSRTTILEMEKLDGLVVKYGNGQIKEIKIKKGCTTDQSKLLNYYIKGNPYTLGELESCFEKDTISFLKENKVSIVGTILKEGKALSLFRSKLKIGYLRGSSGVLYPLRCFNPQRSCGEKQIEVNRDFYNANKGHLDSKDIKYELEDQFQDGNIKDEFCGINPAEYSVAKKYCRDRLVRARELEKSNKDCQWVDNMDIPKKEGSRCASDHCLGVAKCNNLYKKVSCRSKCSNKFDGTCIFSSAN